MEAHETRDEQFAAQGVLAGGGDGVLQEEGVADGAVDDAVENVCEEFALCLIKKHSLALTHSSLSSLLIFPPGAVESDTYHKIVALLERITRKVATVLVLVFLEDGTQVGVAALHDNGDHQGLSALVRLDRLVQVLDILIDELVVERQPAALIVVLLHAALFQGHQDGLFEFIFLELRLHALGQAVVVLLVRKGILDAADLLVCPAHERLDQQLSARLVALVPEVGPVGLALPLPQSNGVARLHQEGILVLEAGANVLGNVDALAVRAGLYNLFVLGAELHDLLVRQAGEDFDDGRNIGSVAALEGLGKTRGNVLRIVEASSPVEPGVALTVRER